MYAPPPLPVFAKPRGEAAAPSTKRAKSSFFGSSIVEELAAVGNRSRASVGRGLDDSKRSVPKRKVMGFRRSKGSGSSANLEATKATTAQRLVTVEERNSELLPHVELLSLHIRKETTYKLLLGYDDTKPVFESFTEGQIEHCIVQCRALHDYMQTIITNNTGEQSSMTQLQCAELAATRTHGKACAQTIQRWYNHNYVANKGFLAPRDSGKYERDSFVEWFVMQEDLLARFLAGMKKNLRIMSLKVAADVLNNVLKLEYEDAEDVDDAEVDEEVGDEVDNDNSPTDPIIGRKDGRGKGCKRRGVEIPDFYAPPSRPDVPAGAVDARSYIFDRFSVVWPLNPGQTLRRLLAHPKVSQLLIII
jgi:hypothetical protein